MSTSTILSTRYQEKDYYLNLDILQGNTFFDKGDSTSRRSARAEQSVYGAVASFAAFPRSSRKKLIGRSNLTNSNSARAEGAPSFALLAADYFLLHEYVKNGDVKTSEFLIRQGIDVNQKDLKQFEAIHYAACYGNVELLHLLVSYGADVNALDGSGMSALHLSVLTDNFPFVEELILTYSAYINLRDNHHSTAIDYANDERTFIFLYNNGGFFGVDFNLDDLFALLDDDDNDYDDDNIIDDDDTLLDDDDDDYDDDNINDEDDETLLDDDDDDDEDDDIVDDDDNNDDDDDDDEDDETLLDDDDDDYNDDNIVDEDDETLWVEDDAV